MCIEYHIKNPAGEYLYAIKRTWYGHPEDKYVFGPSRECALKFTPPQSRSIREGLNKNITTSRYTLEVVHNDRK